MECATRIIGPSGSGKSSLVFAGLLPVLHKRQPQEWTVITMRPGSTPTTTLTDALGAMDGTISEEWHKRVNAVMRQHPSSHRMLVVVDQFEEVFVQADETERTAFFDAVRSLQQTERCTVLLTVRADFYPDFMHSPLWPPAPGQRLELGPLQDDALREAITRPAEQVKVYLEKPLVERLLMDAANEPGVLPMVQETMQLLWERMERRLLTLSAYERLGNEEHSGLAVAMATKADATLAQLTDDQRSIARRIFLRLIQFGEGRADTRRQQSVSELLTIDDDLNQFDHVLQHLTANRLLTLGRKEEGARRTVDIAHEALIGGWPALQDWLDERREAEKRRRRLKSEAKEWERLDRDTGSLLRGAQLVEAEEWIENYGTETNPLEREFLDASLALRKQEEAEREAQRQRELEAAKRLAKEAQARQQAEAERAREAERREHEQAEAASQLRRRAILLAGLGLVALAAAVVAFLLFRRAEQQRQVAFTRHLAAQSLDVQDIELSLLLAQEALRVGDNSGVEHILEANNALRRALAKAPTAILWS